MTQGRRDSGLDQGDSVESTDFLGGRVQGVTEKETIKPTDTPPPVLSDN